MIKRVMLSFLKSTVNGSDVNGSDVRTVTRKLGFFRLVADS